MLLLIAPFRLLITAIAIDELHYCCRHAAIAAAAAAIFAPCFSLMLPC